MQADIDANYPSSPVQIMAINEHGADSANDVATAINDLPFLQDVDQNSDGESDVWSDWWTGDGPYDPATAWRDVHVVDPDGERQDIYNLTTFDIGIQENYDTLKGMIVDAATAKRVAQSPWQNRVEPLDTNNDGNVVPNDALRVINRINGDGAGELPAQLEGSSYFDVTGDNFVTARDVLVIIQHLNRVSAAGGEPAGEPPADVVPPVDSVSASSADAFFAAIQPDSDEDSEIDDLSLAP